jgi:hypothetical protein
VTSGHDVAGRDSSANDPRAEVQMDPNALDDAHSELTASSSTSSAKTICDTIAPLFVTRSGAKPRKVLENFENFNL